MFESHSQILKNGHTVILSHPSYSPRTSELDMLGMTLKNSHFLQLGPLDNLQHNLFCVGFFLNMNKDLNILAIKPALLISLSVDISTAS